MSETETVEFVPPVESTNPPEEAPADFPEDTHTEDEVRKKSPFVLSGTEEAFRLEEPEFKPTGLTWLTINCATVCELGCGDCALGTEGRSPENDFLESDPDKRRRNAIKRVKILAVRTKIPEIVERFSHLGTRQIVVIGNGEPTFQPSEDSRKSDPEPGFREIVVPLITSAHEAGLGTTMFSTLTYLTPEKARQLADNGVTTIVSLHSLDPEKYKKVVRSGHPERVKENIDDLTDAYEYPADLGDGQKLTRLAVNFTLNQWNDSEEEIVATREWAHRHGMVFVVNAKMSQGRGEGEAIQDVVGDQVRYDEQKRLAIQYSDTGGEKGGQSSTTEEGFCGFGRNGMAFNTDGTMMICGYEPGVKAELERVMPNILDLIKLPDGAIIEFSQIMSDDQLWIGLQNACITRADPEKREVFMTALREKVLTFRRKHGLSRLADGSLMN